MAGSSGFSLDWSTEKFRNDWRNSTSRVEPKHASSGHNYLWWQFLKQKTNFLNDIMVGAWKVNSVWSPREWGLLRKCFCCSPRDEYIFDDKICILADGLSDQLISGITITSQTVQTSGCSSCSDRNIPSITWQISDSKVCHTWGQFETHMQLSWWWS